MLHTSGVVQIYFDGAKFLPSQGGGRRAEARGPKPEARRAEAWGSKGRKRGWDSWRRGSEPPPHQLVGLGERCKLPQRCPGRSPGKFETSKFTTEMPYNLSVTIQRGWNIEVAKRHSQPGIYLLGEGGDTSPLRLLPPMGSTLLLWRQKWNRLICGFSGIIVAWQYCYSLGLVALLTS